MRVLPFVLLESAGLLPPWGACLDLACGHQLVSHLNHLLCFLSVLICLVNRDVSSRHPNQTAYSLRARTVHLGHEAQRELSKYFWVCMRAQSTRAMFKLCIPYTTYCAGPPHGHRKATKKGESRDFVERETGVRNTFLMS